jgi:hypothetical protein
MILVLSIERSDLAKKGEYLLLLRTPAKWWLTKSWTIDKDDPPAERWALRY